MSRNSIGWLLTVGIIAVAIVKCDNCMQEAATPTNRTTKKMTRQDSIAEQFSVWDGSHSGMKAVVKSMMKNPKSFEHVESGYKDEGDYILVQMVYRGTNSFGGVVTQSSIAKFTVDGRFIELVE